MRTPKNENAVSVPKISIKADGKYFQVYLTPLEEFIEEVSMFMNINDLEVELDLMESSVIDATEDRVQFECVKRQLKLIRQMKYLFRGLYCKEE